MSNCAVLVLLACSLTAAFHTSPRMGPHKSPAIAVARSCSTGTKMLAKKKGGKKKGGGGPKQSGMAWAQNFEIKPTESNELRELAETAVSTYKTRTGKVMHRIFDRGGDVPKALWTLPLCVMVVKEKEGASVVTYANQAAVEAHELPTSDGYKKVMDAPTVLPAKLEGKFDSGYSKKIALKSEGGAADDAEAAAKKITVLDADRYALEKMAVVDGKIATERIGIVYAWEAWELEDGTTCKPGGVREAPAIDPAEVEAAVEAQGAKIRALKGEGGLTNQDPEVVEAVAELQRLKALLAAED